MIIVNSAGERASRGSGRRQVAKERFGPVGSRTPVRVTEAPFANPRPRSSTRFRARSACSVEQGTRVEEHRGSRGEEHPEKTRPCRLRRNLPDEDEWWKLLRVLRR